MNFEAHLYAYIHNDDCHFVITILSINTCKNLNYKCELST